jgi:hypothetical protein
MICNDIFKQINEEKFLGVKFFCGAKGAALDTFFTAES